MRFFIALALVFSTSAAFAGAQFCPDKSLPYFFEKIPHGIAIVRINSADYCKKDLMSLSNLYHCDGNKEYSFALEETKTSIALIFYDDSIVTAERCYFETD